jgi:hypothetical protein
MTREEADARREMLQRDDHEHTYFVHEQPAGEWEVVRTNLPGPTLNVVAQRGEPTPPPEDARPFLIRQIPPYGPPGF